MRITLDPGADVSLRSATRREGEELDDGQTFALQNTSVSGEPVYIAEAPQLKPPSKNHFRRIVSYTGNPPQLYKMTAGNDIWVRAAPGETGAIVVSP